MTPAQHGVVYQMATVASGQQQQQQQQQSQQQHPQQQQQQQPQHQHQQQQQQQQQHSMNLGLYPMLQPLFLPSGATLQHTPLLQPVGSTVLPVGSPQHQQGVVMWGVGGNPILVPSQPAAHQHYAQPPMLLQQNQPVPFSSSEVDVNLSSCAEGRPSYITSTIMLPVQCDHVHQLSPEHHMQIPTQAQVYNPDVDRPVAGQGRRQVAPPLHSPSRGEELSQGHPALDPRNYHPENRAPSSIEALMKRDRKVRSWTPIPLNEMTAGLPPPPGHVFDVYDAGLVYYYQLPSEDIVMTVGAMRYAEHYNEHGRYSRYRFQLCGQFASGKCTKGSQCTYIHARQLPPVGSPSVWEVHLLAYDGAGVAAKMAKGRRYPRLPSGELLAGGHPNIQGAVFSVPSQLVLRTVGGEAAMLRARGICTKDAAMAAGATETVAALVENVVAHCAHFQFRRLCHRGAVCHRLHSTVPLLAGHNNEQSLEGFQAAVANALQQEGA